MSGFATYQEAMEQLDDWAADNSLEALRETLTCLVLRGPEEQRPGPLGPVIARATADRLR